MPGLHVYCVMPRGPVPDEALRGIDDAAVRVIPAGDIAFWASAHDRRPLAVTVAAGAHNRVVEAGMNTTVTPVPVRFGQWFDSDEAAVAALSPDAARWAALLERFAGRAEWGVRIMGMGPARDVHPARTQTGTAYMVELARRKTLIDERRSAAERVVQQIATEVGNLADETRVEFAAGGDVASLCHLVAWSDAEAYHTQVRAARDAHRTLRFLFTGPWPPYSFVE